MLALLPLLLQIVPSIATLVAGGKQGGVLYAAAKVARDVLGTDDPAEVEAKLADPATAETFKARMEAETAQMQAQLADVANARAMQVALVNAPEHGMVALMPSLQTFANWIVAIVVVAGVGLHWFREDGIVVGFALGAWAVSNTFWLGSSAGSKRNADTNRAIALDAALPGVGQVADAVRRAVR